MQKSFSYCVDRKMYVRSFFLVASTLHLSSPRRGFVAQEEKFIKFFFFVSLFVIPAQAGIHILQALYGIMDSVITQIIALNISKSRFFLRSMDPRLVLRMTKMGKGRVKNMYVRSFFLVASTLHLSSPRRGFVAQEEKFIKFFFFVSLFVIPAQAGIHILQALYGIMDSVITQIIALNISKSRFFLRSMDPRLVLRMTKMGKGGVKN